MRSFAAALFVLLATSWAAASSADTPAMRWRTLHVAGQVLLVGTPAWYSPARHPALPLVISPHARGGDPFKNARRWGDLPGRREFIVIAPTVRGRVFGPMRAWGYPPAITRLARSPAVARSRLAWLRWDRDRVY